MTGRTEQDRNAINFKEFFEKHESVPRDLGPYESNFYLVEGGGDGKA